MDRFRRISLLALIALGRAAQADDWVMGFHDSRHTGQTSEIVAPPLTVAWTWKDNNAYDTSAKFNPQPRFWLPIYYRNKICFQGGLNANRLFCLNPADGSKAWEADNPGYTAAGTYLFQFDNYPAAVAGRIVNASTDFTASVDAATGGDPHNTYNTNGGWPFGGAASWNGLGYIQFVRTDDGTEAFNIVQDATNWTLNWGYASPDNKTTFTDYGFRVPAVDAYVTYTNFQGVLVAGDALTRRTLWTWGKTNPGSSPAVLNGVVYFYANSQHEIVALDASHAPPARILWSAPINGAYSPIVSDGVVYVGAADGYFYALDAATGAKKWALRTGAPFTPLQIPAISGDLIYVPGANGTLYVLQKKTGAKVWSYSGLAQSNPTPPAWGPVAIAGGMVFASQQTTLYAFRPEYAALGPTVTALSIARASNAQAVSVNLTGSGFFGGGSVPLVVSIQFDDPAGTALTGYTVASDQSINGVMVPAGMAPGIYHIRVRTSVGQTANEPSLAIEAAGSSFVSTLGQSTGPYSASTAASFQRHIVRLRDSTLLAAYIGPSGDGGAQYATYNFSRDGGLTWSAQSQLLAAPWTVIWAPTSSIFADSPNRADSQNRLNVSYIQWPSYAQTFTRMTIGGNGVLTPGAGYPVFPSKENPDFPGAIVAEPGGRLWVAYPTGGSLSALYSDDGGVTWTATPAINKTKTSTVAMVAYQGKPAVIFGAGTALAWSAWDGQQWSTPDLLAGAVPSGQPALSAVVTGGQVQIAYAATGGGVKAASYSGSAWSSAQVLDPSGSGPSLTTDGASLWCFYTNAAGDLVYRRTNNGQWAPAVAITSDGNSNTSAATLELSPDPLIPVIWTAGASTAYTVKSAVVARDPAAPPGAGPAPFWVGPPSATISAGQTVQFTATAASTWNLSPVAGTIDASGLYTAPAAVIAAQIVTVTATSTADGRTARAAITLAPSQPVTVTPSVVRISAGSIQPFTADVPVTWSLSPNTGTISNDGVYRAPRAIAQQQTVTVTATSTADATKTGTANIMLVRGRR